MVALEAFECNTTSDWLNQSDWFSQSELVIYSNLQILKEKKRNTLDNGCVEPHSSVGSGQDLRTGGLWFDPRLGQDSLRGLIKGVATGVIPLSMLSVVSAMVIWKSCQ